MVNKADRLQHLKSAKTNRGKKLVFKGVEHSPSAAPKLRAVKLDDWRRVRVHAAAPGKPSAGLRVAVAEVDLVTAQKYMHTLRLQTPEVTRRLIATLGGTLVSTLAGSKDVKAAHRWARADGPKPRPITEEKLRFAYEQWQKVAQVEGETVARAWFIGANPWLNYDTPVLAIREGRFADVNAAANALSNDAFGG